MIRFSFDNPVYLWYLLSIPLLIYTHFYLLRHAKSRAMVFANFEALKRVTGERLITKNITVLVLRVIILVCVIVAASGATLWYEGKVNKNNFVIAIDISASMSAQDVIPTRIEAAKSTAKHFVDNIKSQSEIGIISFSSTTFIDSTPMDNKESLKKTIDNIEITKTGGTDIAGAIITGTNMLLPYDKGKTIVVITDGSNTVGAFMQDSIKNAIDYANRNHVVIHALGIGSEAGPIGYLPEYYNITSTYNMDVLNQVSNSTGGAYYQANTREQLILAENAISMVSDKAFIPIKLSHGLMLFALILLFLEWGFISTRFRRLP